MFRKKTILTTTLIVLISCLSLLKVFQVSRHDLKAYKRTLDYLQPIHQQQQGITHRNRVTKNLWMQKKDQLYQYMITSEGSTLHLNQLKSKETKVIEEMEKAICLLQQKLFFVDEAGQEVSPLEAKGLLFPRQQLCKLEVESGVYNYFTKKFEGQNVQIEVIELPTHDFHAQLPLDKGRRLLQGECDQIHFYFIENLPNLKVENLVAQIFGKPTK